MPHAHAMRWYGWWLVVGLAGAVEPSAPVATTVADADKAQVEGLAAYDQALVEDLLGNADQVRSRLRQARRWFDQATAILEEKLKRSSDAELARKLVEARRAGRPCCGKRSLWDRYPLAPDAGGATPGRPVTAGR